MKKMFTQNDLITSHFKNIPSKVDSSEYYITNATGKDYSPMKNFRERKASTTAKVVTAKRTSVFDALFFGGEDTAEENEVKKYDTNDLITAFCYGVGGMFIILITLLHGLGN